MRFRIDAFVLPAGAGIDSPETYAALARRAAKIGASSGTSSNWFEQRCSEFREHVGTDKRIEAFANQKKDVRVVLHLWKVDAEWLEWSPPAAAALKHLYVLAGGFRSSHLSALQDVYFRFYDGVPQHAVLGKLISDCLARLAPERLLPVQRKLRRHSAQVFSANGPIAIAKQAIAGGADFQNHVDLVGLGQHGVGRYAQACKNAYYIETVRGLRMGEYHRVLDELAKPEAKESSYDGKLNLGQKVAQVLIRRCAKESTGMPEKWVDYIKDLMCDPRVPVRTRGYQKWWAAMEGEDEANMRRWLAGADLRLFLKILKHSSSDEDLQRMYPARRKFLEGLLAHHDIVDARLFLSSNAQALIRKEYGSEYLAAHGLLSDRIKTVIYVNIENKIHFFEGTHNFKARGGGVLPDNHRATARAVRHFDYSNFTTKLERDLTKAGEAHNPPLEIFSRRHYPPIGWQHELIWEFEYYNVKVDPETVLTSADYRKYRRMYGI